MSSTSNAEHTARQTNQPPDRNPTNWIQEWNRIFLLVCAAGLAIDPLFFYALSISGSCMCLFIDGWLAVTVTVLRCIADVVQLGNVLVKMKMGCYGSKRQSEEEGDVYMGRRGRDMSKKELIFDLFVILPVPQVSFHSILALVLVSSLSYYKISLLQ